MSSLPDFCNLHNHDTYSVLDGLGTVDEMVNRAAELGQPYLAQTNHASLSGVFKFIQSCGKKGIAPVIGTELYVVDDLERERRSKRYHLLAWASSQEGYFTLVRLLNIANRPDHFYYRPRLTWGEILNDPSPGLMYSSACVSGMLSHKNVRVLTEDFSSVFKNRFFLEIMPHNFDEQMKVNRLALSFSKKFNIPLLATNDSHYVLESDCIHHEALLAMQSGKTLADEDRWSFNIKGLHLRSAEEMGKALFEMGIDKRNCLRSIGLAGELGKQLTWSWKNPPFELANPLPPGINPNKFLIDESKKGLQRLGLAHRKEYILRLKEELTIIIKKGFSSYLILVWDLVRWCKENGILVGPGRGSIGGSLLAWVIGITAVDPVKFGLSFWRFISPDRIDLPDIDLDFEHERRGEVIEYLRQRYGEEGVAHIANFGMLRARMALRDSARIHSFADTGLVDHVAKLINAPLVKEDDSELQVAYEADPEVRAFATGNGQIWDTALKLEGRIRQVGVHAAGVVIAPKTLNARCPLMRGKGGELTVALDMRDLEYLGLLKLDILGLRTLTVMRRAIEFIEQDGTTIELDEIPLDDKKVFELFSRGDSTGSFQFETDPMKWLLRKMAPVVEFSDLVAACALIRPGTSRSGLADTFMERRAGREPIYDSLYFPGTKHILEETFGIVLYQEQLMQICNEAALMSWEDCDKMRKIVKEKQGSAAFLKYEEKFVSGAENKGGVTRRKAQEFFRSLLDMSGYAFIKAHSTTYAMIGYWGAWLKVHYPAQFMASFLADLDETKKRFAITEAKALGLKLLPPDVNVSHSQWVPEGRTQLRCGLLDLKGIGLKACAAVINERTARGKFKDENDFLNRIPKRTVNSRSRTILMEAGAFPWEQPKNGNTFFIPNMQVGPGEINVSPLKNLKYAKKIFTAIKECKRCDAYKQCKAPVPFRFKRNSSPIIFGVAEAPGREENSKGKPLIGSAGKVLMEMLVGVGLPEDLFYWTNLLKCRPPNNKIAESAEYIPICSKHWLRAEIEIFKPKIIWAMGKTSAGYFQDGKFSIWELHGKAFQASSNSPVVFYTVHPAAILYDRSRRDEFESALMKLKELIAV